tara:strand:- start:314 stop:949 length:636 start_codon:yes stop_codon:yes gene_type:complete
MNLVQLGANSGRDHVLDFVNTFKTDIKQIVLVEPAPYILKELKETYKDFINVKIDTSAIIPSFWEEGEVDFHLVVPEDHHLTQSKLPAYMACKTATLDKNWIEEHDRYYDEHGKTIKVKGIHFDTLISKYNLDKVDFLFLDIEGLDCELLNSINLNKYNFKLIYWEDVRKNRILENKLKNLGYIITLTENKQKVAYKKEYENYLQNFGCRL